MFMKRIQPFQLGFTDYEVQIAIKVFSGEDLTDDEERRADKILNTMKTQYERLRVKTNDDYRRDDRSDDWNDHRGDDAHSDRSRLSYGDAKIARKRDETYTVPPEATKPARRAVRTSR